MKRNINAQLVAIFLSGWLLGWINVAQSTDHCILSHSTIPVAAQIYSKYCTITAPVAFFSGNSYACSGFTNSSVLNFLIKIVGMDDNWQLGSLKLTSGNPQLVLDQSVGIECIRINRVQYLILEGFDGGINLDIQKLNKLFIATLVLVNNQISFYLPNGTLIDLNICENIDFDEFVTDFLITNSEILILERNTYSMGICPFMFNNSVVKEISLVLGNESHNMAMFMNVEKDNKIFITSLEKLRIRSIDNTSMLTLHKYLVSPILFEQINEILLVNFSSVYIEAGLFKHLPNLQSISIELVNTRLFFKRNDFRWLSDLNPRIQVPEESNQFNVDLAMEYLKSNPNSVFNFHISMKYDSGYTFPETDICLYVDFPHYKLIYPLFESNPNLKPTCTLIWLTLVWRFIELSLPNQTTYTGPWFLENASFSDMIKQCSFDTLLPASCHRLDNKSANYTLFISKLVSYSASASHLIPFPIIILFLVFFYIFYQ